MSTDAIQNLNAQISQYQQQKQNCEIELSKTQTNLAVAQSQLNSINQQAQAQFGTTDLNQLQQIQASLLLEKEQLEQQLNQL